MIRSVPQGFFSDDAMKLIQGKAERCMDQIRYNSEFGGEKP